MNMQKVLKFSRQKERNLENVMGGYIGATVLMSPNLASNFHMQLTLCFCLFHIHPQSQTCVYLEGISTSLWTLSTHDKSTSHMA